MINKPVPDNSQQERLERELNDKIDAETNEPKKEEPKLTTEEKMDDDSDKDAQAEIDRANDHDNRLEPVADKNTY